MSWQHRGQRSTAGLPSIESSADLVGVRQLVRNVLAGYDEAILADAVQIADLPTTTAIQHGQPPHEFRLAIPVAEPCLRIEVDTSLAFTMLDEPSGTAEVPRMLLDQLTAGWGVRRQRQRAILWAQLDLV